MEKINLFKPNPDYDNFRKVNSRACCELIAQFFEINPYLRFWQGIEIIQSELYSKKDIFSEEPDVTLTKLKKFIDAEQKKSILDDIDSISIFKDASKFGYEHWYKPETILIAGTWGNKTSPIAYIHKPKHISLEDWNKFKDKLQINLLK